MTPKIILYLQRLGATENNLQNPDSLDNPDIPDSQCNPDNLDMDDTQIYKADYHLLQCLSIHR